VTVAVVVRVGSARLEGQAVLVGWSGRAAEPVARPVVEESEAAQAALEVEE